MSAAGDGDHNAALYPARRSSLFGVLVIYTACGGWLVFRIARDGTDGFAWFAGIFICLGVLWVAFRLAGRVPGRRMIECLAEGVMRLRYRRYIYDITYAATRAGIAAPTPLAYADWRDAVLDVRRRTHDSVGTPLDGNSQDANHGPSNTTNEG